mgnify:CR=1 FL=1
MSSSWHVLKLSSAGARAARAVQQVQQLAWGSQQGLGSIGGPTIGCVEQTVRMQQNVGAAGRRGQHTGQLQDQQ